MSFILVHESAVDMFCFWKDDLCQGMRHSNEIYIHVSTMSSEQRMQAYELSDELVEAGEKVCLTVSASSYSVWRNLRGLSS